MHHQTTAKVTNPNHRDAGWVPQGASSGQKQGVRRVEIDKGWYNCLRDESPQGRKDAKQGSTSTNTTPRKRESEKRRVLAELDRVQSARGAGEGEMCGGGWEREQ